MRVQDMAEQKFQATRDIIDMVKLKNVFLEETKIATKSYVFYSKDQKRQNPSQSQIVLHLLS